MKRLWLLFAALIVFGVPSPENLMAAERKTETSTAATQKKTVAATKKTTPKKTSLPPLIAMPGAWATVKGPTKGKTAILGSYAQGCISGAVPLPLEAPGYQVLRTKRNRFYGHPSLIAYVKKLSQQTRKASLPGFLIGDLSQPRGGPMTFGHSSHQTGLDIDIWFRLSTKPLPKAELEHPRPVSLIDPANRAINPETWTSNHARLIRIAAAFPEVERIFVNPVIKRMLCETERGDRRWIAKLRPWRGHDEHFHVRLRCPQSMPGCVAQKPLQRDDNGCGEELDRWINSDSPLTFPDSDATMISATKLPGQIIPKAVRTPPPPECLKVLQEK